MKYFAEVINNTVVNLVQTEEDSLDNFPTNGKFIEYSEDGSFRYNPAAIGSQYNAERDAFIPLKIHESWTLNEETLKWEAPVPKPEGPAAWDEANQRWNTPE